MPIPKPTHIYREKDIVLVHGTLRHALKGFLLSRILAKKLILNLSNQSTTVSGFKKVIWNFIYRHARRIDLPYHYDVSNFFYPAHYRPTIKKIAVIADKAAKPYVMKEYPQVTWYIVKHLKDLPEPLHRFDIVVHSNPQTDWGEVYLQAFASGVTVVTLPVPHLENILQNNVNCLISADPSSLVPHTSFLLDHPEETYRLAKNAQMWLKQNPDQILTKAWMKGLYAEVS